MSHWEQQRCELTDIDRDPECRAKERDDECPWGPEARSGVGVAVHPTDLPLANLSQAERILMPWSSCSQNRGEERGPSCKVDNSGRCNTPRSSAISCQPLKAVVRNLFGTSDWCFSDDLRWS